MATTDTHDEASQDSFGDNLTELERLRQELKGMFVPGPGWDWHMSPREFHIQSVQAPSGTVVQGMLLAGRRGSNGLASEPRLGISIAQGGADRSQQREYRPVAYAKDGSRQALRAGMSASSWDDSGQWVGANLFVLEPDVLSPDAVAFLGVEVRQPTDADDS
jgi:hypothetical protein